MAGRVHSFVVVGADLANGHQLVADEVVHDGRLADAARADEHGGPPGRDACAQLVHPLAGDCTDDVHRNAERDCLDLGDHRLRVVDPVDLREHDLRRRAALPDRHEVALDAARLQLGAERADDERDVDVRRECLCLSCASSGVAHERAVAGEDAADQPVAEPDPVADRDVGVLVQHPSGQARAHDLFGCLHVVGRAMRGGHASGNEPGVKLFGELGVPAECT